MVGNIVLTTSQTFAVSGLKFFRIRLKIKDRRFWQNSCSLITRSVYAGNQHRQAGR
jgi:hypothetical protein